MKRMPVMKLQNNTEVLRENNRPHIKTKESNHIRYHLRFQISLVKMWIRIRVSLRDFARNIE